MAFFKKIFKRIFQFKIYRRIIVSFGLIFIATVVILSCLLFYLFSTSATKEIDNTSKQMLAQTSYASDVIYNQATNISTQLFNDNNILSLINSKEVDKIVYYNISRQLSNIQNIYPFITSIGIYNLQTGLSYDTKNIPIDETILNKSEKTYIEFFPRKVTTRFYSRETSYNLITFVIFPEFSMSSTPYVAIVININQSYILNTASSISGIPPESSTFVMDSKGLIISHFNSVFFMKNVSSQNYIQNILEENEKIGSSISEIDAEKHLITYVKPDKIDWYFVSIKPYNQLLGNIYNLQRTMFLISLALIAVGIIISFLLTSVIYNPIKSLMDKVGNVNGNKDISLLKYDEYKYLSEAFLKSQESAYLLNSSIEKTSFLLKENYLYNILKGNLSKIDLPPVILEGFSNHFTSPYYCVIIFKIDNFQSLKQSIQQKDQSLFRFAVSNIAQELLLRHFQNETIMPEEDEVVVLAQLNEKKLPDEIYLSLAEIQDAIRNHFNFTISIYINDVLCSSDGIAESYKDLQEFGKYHLFYGNECVIDSEKFRSHALKSSFYPYDIEKKLLNALHLCDTKLIQKCITDFIDYIYKVNYYEAVNYSNQIMSSIIKNYNGILDLQDNIFKRYLDIDLINQAETIQDISHIFSELCSKICNLIVEKNSSLNTQRYRKIIEDMKKYIEDNYSNPNLSLESVANIVDLSSGYLGKLFKNITSLSFNDYLNNLRLEKAKELLCTTSEPASKICEKVGIYNITYFSTLFKKTYGITPSQFRGNK